MYIVVFVVLAFQSFCSDEDRTRSASFLRSWGNYFFQWWDASSSEELTPEQILIKDLEQNMENIHHSCSSVNNAKKWAEQNRHITRNFGHHIRGFKEQGKVDQEGVMLNIRRDTALSHVLFGYAEKKTFFHMWECINMLVSGKIMLFIPRSSTQATIERCLQEEMKTFIYWAEAPCCAVESRSMHIAFLCGFSTCDVDLSISVRSDVGERCWDVFKRYCSLCEGGVFEEDLDDFTKRMLVKYKEQIHYFQIKGILPYDDERVNSILKEYFISVSHGTKSHGFTCQSALS